MSKDAIVTIASMIVGGLVFVMIAFAAFVFWRAWQKGARNANNKVSAAKGGRAQASVGKRRKK